MGNGKKKTKFNFGNFNLYKHRTSVERLFGVLTIVWILIELYLDFIKEQSLFKLFSIDLTIPEVDIPVTIPGLGVKYIAYFVLVLLTVLTPLLVRLIIVGGGSMIDRIKLIFLTKNESKKGVKKYFKYSPYPTLIASLLLLVFTKVISIVRFQIKNQSSDKITILTDWVSNGQLSGILDRVILYIFLYFLFVVFYTTYCFGIAGEIKKEQSYDPEKEETTYINGLIILLIAGDVISNLMTFYILYQWDSGNEVATRLFDVLWYLSMGRLVLAFYMIQWIYKNVTSTYFYNYNIRRGIAGEDKNAYWFNATQLNLLVQLSNVVYWDKKEIEDEFNSIHQIWSDLDITKLSDTKKKKKTTTKAKKVKKMNQSSELRTLIHDIFQVPKDKIDLISFISNKEETINKKKRKDLFGQIRNFTFKELSDYVYESTQGFLCKQERQIQQKTVKGISTENKLAYYLTFRGTEPVIEDILLNLEFQYNKMETQELPTPSTPMISITDSEEQYQKLRKDIKVHTGFYKGYDSVQTKVLADIIGSLLEYANADGSKGHNLSKFSSVEIYISGHSLGGAIANIASVELYHWFLEKTQDPSNPAINDEICDLIVENQVQNGPTKENEDDEPTDNTGSDVIRNEIQKLFEIIKKEKIRIEIRMFNIGSPKVGNYQFKYYYSSLRMGWRVMRLLKQRGLANTYDNNRVVLDYLRSRNDKEWAPFLPPLGYTHILPAVFWTNNGMAKYQTEANKYSFSNVKLLSYSDFLRNIISDSTNPLTFIQEIDTMTQKKLTDRLKDTTEDVFEELISDHSGLYHLHLWLKFSGERIYFPNLYDKYIEKVKSGAFK